MKSDGYISRRIIARIRRKSVTPPVFAGDFLDLGDRPAIDQALSRLARRGMLCRVGRGLYALPRVSRLTGTATSLSPDSIARARARKLGLRILPSPAYAANLLGLSTQVPAKIIYLTVGRDGIIRAGTANVIFRHGSPKTMAVSGRMAPLVFQALRYLGRPGVSEAHLGRLSRLLKKKDKRELMGNLCNASGWMRGVLLRIAGKTQRGKPWTE